MIYLDNAATTQMSDVAIEALIKITKENYGNASSIYSYGRKSRKILDESRRIIAECIGAAPEEIYFTSGGTESDNWAVAQAIALDVDQIITSKIEHHAVLNPIKKIENTGMKVTYLPVDSGCVIDLDVLKEVLNGNKAFVSLMYQNNETGVLQPIKEATKIVHENNSNSIVHTDAVQAIGHIKINVKDLGIDMMSASAHKFNGPKGVGFFYVRHGCIIDPLIYGGGQENNFRSGTENVAAIYSMAKALEENVNTIDEYQSCVKSLEQKFFTLLDMNDIKYCLNSNEKNRATGIINISIKNIDGEGLLNMLDMQDIYISVGSACNSESKEPSYVLKAMMLDEERINSSVRISIGKYNTEDDIEKIISYLKKIYRIMQA